MPGGTEVIEIDEDHFLLKRPCLGDVIAGPVDEEAAAVEFERVISADPVDVDGWSAVRPNKLVSTSASPRGLVERVRQRRTV